MSIKSRGYDISVLTDSTAERDSEPFELHGIENGDISVVYREGVESITGYYDRLRRLQSINTADQGLYWPSILRERDII